MHQQVWRSLTECTTILFAHEGQKKAFIETCQNDKEMYSHVLLTIDVFVQDHLQVEAPIISPDQRWLLIAKSMTTAQCEALSLGSHRAALSFARRLYSLWTAAWESGHSLNGSDVIWDDWQRPWIKICHEVFVAYQKNLETMGYTDLVFLSWRRAQSKNVVLANITRMSHQARYILENCKVMAFHQGPSHWFDPNGDLLCLSEWTNDKGLIKTQSVIEMTVSHESQERQVLRDLSPVNVMDPRQRPLWLNPTMVSMTRTMLFQFWNTWLLISKRGKGSRIPIDLVKTLLFNRAFSVIYEWPDEVFSRFWHSLKVGVRWWHRHDFMPEKMLSDSDRLFPFDVRSIEKLIVGLPEVIWTERGLDEIRYQFGSVWESFKESFQDGLIPSDYALDYLVDRLSSRTIKREDNQTLSARRPNECLNISASERFFTGVMEGLIPSSMEPPWLLMPKQLSAWGLRSPLMVQTIEAYSWTQALLTCKKATVVLYHNGQDFRPPSLWTWLREGLPIEVNSCPAPFLTCSPSKGRLEVKKDSAGLPVPLTAFPTRPLSFSAYDTWRNCPYQYALSKGYRLQIADTNTLTKVDPSFMGQLAHDWLDVVMAEGKRLSTAELNSMAKKIWSRNAHHWPLDLEGLLVEKILIPDMVDMAKGLLKCIDQQVGFDNIKTLIHEESVDKLLPQTEEIIFSGRADLRIETKTDEYWIIDYKSGTQSNDLQLNWYALLYYGHVHPSQINLAFYDIPNRRFKLVKTQLDTVNDVNADWQKALVMSTQLRTVKISHCQYCGLGELCRK